MYISIKNEEILVKKANNLFKRFKGLMFNKNFRYGMYFPKTNAIHTFFMKKNIDIIAIDENNKIIFKKENVSKNKIIHIKHPIKKTGIIEFPVNYTKNMNIGDELSFISK